MNDTGLSKDRYPRVMRELADSGWITWRTKRRHPETKEWMPSEIIIHSKRQKPGSGEAASGFSRSGFSGSGSSGSLSNINYKSRARPQDWGVHQEEVIEESCDPAESYAVYDELNPPPYPDNFDPNEYCQCLDFAENDETDD
ncbi:MAG: hypothetical protein AAGA12_09770 [Pseudomonadota bacterium]